MHEVRWSARNLGHREGTSHRRSLGQRRTARGEMRHVALAGAEQTFSAESDQVFVLGVNREQCSAVARHFERTHVVARTSFEALHHENLDAGDAAIDDERDLSNCLGRRIEQRDVKAVVDNRATTRFGLPLFDRVVEQTTLRLEGVVDDGRHPRRSGRSARLEVIDRVHREHLGVEMSMRIDSARNESIPTRIDGTLRAIPARPAARCSDLVRD